MQPNEPKSALTLEDLLGLVREVISMDLAESYWVVAEIASLRVQSNGNYRVDVVQKSGERTIAKADAVVLASNVYQQFSRFERQTGQKLHPGMSVLMRVSVMFHVLYGLSLLIRDIDPAYTLGDMARKRREVIERLEGEGLLTRNKTLAFPLVPQRIAIISSAQAAGYEDFVHQIEGNAHGYRFRHKLFAATMQGRSAEAEVCEALSRAALRSRQFDLVVIIRGGGSTVDLSCFDGYAIAAAIGSFPIPVITGIGHERDESVADMAAHTRAKTPTAAAELIVGAMRGFEDRLDILRGRIFAGGERVLAAARTRIERNASTLSRQGTGTCLRERSRLAMMAQSLESGALRVLERRRASLERAEVKVQLLDPINVLRRGYSITYADGRLVRSAEQVSNGQVLKTILEQGTIRSVVAAAAQERGGGDMPSNAGDLKRRRGNGSRQTRPREGARSPEPAGAQAPLALDI